MGEGLLGLAVGDVAGKGVPAALYGAFASGMVRARAFERRAPHDLMARVNRTLRRRGVEGLFCTLGYALFDFGARTVRIANSGLPYPLAFPGRHRFVRASGGGRASPGRLRRCDLRGARASTSLRATSSCSTPTG